MNPHDRLPVNNVNLRDLAMNALWDVSKEADEFLAIKTDEAGPLVESLNEALRIA
jgi:hypothetical protein